MQGILNDIIQVVQSLYSGGCDTRQIANAGFKIKIFFSHGY